MTDWFDFLSAQGARIHPSGAVDFTGPAPTAEQTWLAALGQQSFLALDGVDASQFLQGQVTCDLRQLPEQWLLGAQCNLKGRMRGSFTLAAQDSACEHILLRTHRDIQPLLHSGLNKYAVFSKVEISDARDTWHAIALAGPDAARLITQHTGLAPPEVNQYQRRETAIALGVAPQRYELWLRGDTAQSLWRALAAHAVPVSSHHWELANIRAGYAQVRGPTSELFTPQALNYQLIGGVSFKKGCYTGQEVVARLHYKGKLKKYMQRISFAAPANELPLPGTAIVDEHGKSRGELVMAAPASAGQCEALAVLPANREAQLFLSQPLTAITQLDLPYAIPKADNSA